MAIDRWRVFDIVLVLASAACAVTFLINTSDPTADSILLAALLALSVVFGVLSLPIRAFMAEKGARWRATRRGLSLLLLQVALVGAVALLTENRWPLRARFEMSRAALENVAHEALVQPQARNRAERIGLYDIMSVDRDAIGRVQFHLGECLGWYTDCLLVFHPKGDCGSVRHSDERVLDSHWCIAYVSAF